MALLKLKVLDKQGEIICNAEGEKGIHLLLTHTYEEGDRVVFETSEVDAFYIIQVDDAMGEAFVYLTKNEWTYKIPFGEKKVCYSPKTFYGDKHLLTARCASKDEIAKYKNLAKNVIDQHGDTYCYPHATANVETRGEVVFAARNAIDGIVANSSHGAWPYGSWGINQRADATWKLEFGRIIKADKVVIYLRADFPHDNWWKQVTLRFSDDTTMDCELEKTPYGQVINIGNKEITWIQLEKLIKTEEPSPFPALTQVEVYGLEA